MLIIIPLAVIVVSLMAVGAIMWRKLPATMAEWDAAVEEHNYGEPFYQAALVKLRANFKEAGIKLATRAVWQLKIVSLKTDNFSSGLLHKIRQTKEDSGPVLPPPDQSPPHPPNSPDSPAAGQENLLISRLADNPKDVLVYKRLGWLYLKGNNLPQAYEAFVTAVKLGSHDRAVIARLAELEKTLPADKSRTVSMPR